MPKGKVETVDIAQADSFAIALNGILGSIPTEVRAVVPGAITSASREGAETVRRKAEKTFKIHDANNPYWKGFRVKRRSTRDKFYAEIGHRSKPGLVHLLEKGHAKVGGGRVPAYPHLIDGYDAAVEALERELLEGLDKRL